MNTILDTWKHILRMFLAFSLKISKSIQKNIQKNDCK